MKGRFLCAAVHLEMRDWLIMQETIISMTDLPEGWHPETGAGHNCNL